jgi:twinkle protein
MSLITPDMIDFSFYLKETESATKVKPASMWMNELIHDLRNPSQTPKVYMPWQKCRDVFNFREGEVTMWAGQNGHGKSLVTSQIVLSLMGQEQKACIASFEMKPTTTLQRMARMFAGTNPFSPEYQSEDGVEALTGLYRDFGEWSEGKLWLYDQQGTVTADQIIAVARYCAKELGVKHFVIDSLMKCVKGEDDYNGQKDFVDELTSLARDNRIHVHLIHHMKKPSGGEYTVCGKYDAKGSGAISDLVDNFFVVHRNKEKSDDIAAKGSNSLKKNDPDCFLICRKQRNGEDEPKINLWFDRDSQQMLGEATDPLMYFPNFPHRETPY